MNIFSSKFNPRMSCLTYRKYVSELQGSKMHSMKINSIAWSLVNTSAAAEIARNIFQMYIITFIAWVYLRYIVQLSFCCLFMPEQGIL